MGLWQLETGWIYWALLACLVGETVFLRLDTIRVATGRAKARTDPPSGPWSAPAKPVAWFNHPSLSLTLRLALLLCLVLRSPVAILPALLDSFRVVMSGLSLAASARNSTEMGAAIGGMIGGLLQYALITAAIIALAPDGSLPFVT